MKTRLFVMVLLISLLVLAGCTKTLSEITATDEYVGETVSVKGTAQGVTKIGDLSGYVLVDANEDNIVVASERLPAEGDEVIAKGTLLKGPLGFGYYIDVDE